MAKFWPRSMLYIYTINVYIVTNIFKQFIGFVILPWIFPVHFQTVCTSGEDPDPVGFGDFWPAGSGTFFLQI